MSKQIRVISALGAVFFAVVGLAACGGGIPGNAVVQVGGTPITKATFEHWMSVAASSTAATGTTGAKPVVPDPPDYTACIAHLEATAAKARQGPVQADDGAAEERVRTAVQIAAAGGARLLDLLVVGARRSRITGREGERPEVKKQFEKIKNEQFPKAAEFQKFLATSGQTVSDLLLRVKLNLLSTKIQQKIAKEKAPPARRKSKSTTKNIKSQFGTPEKRDVRIVLTKTEAQAKEAKKEIESGKSFASVAKSKSIDPTSKANGGELKGVVKGQEEKALDEAIFSAKKGVLGGPVKTPFGYYIYEVTSTTAGSQQTLAQSEASIKQQLASTGQQQALSKFVKEFRKKWEAENRMRQRL